MAVRTVLINFQSNVGSLTTTMASAAASFRTLEAARRSGNATAAMETQAVMASANAWAARGRTMAIAGAAIAVGIGEAVKAAGQFQSAMNDAAVASDFTRQHLALMSQEILGLSQRLPVSAEELAKALSQAERSGYQAASALALVEQAGKLAAVSGDDVTKTMTDLTGIMNAYGMTAKDSLNVTNVLTVAWRNGTGSMQQISDAIKSVAPVASEAKIPIEQVAGAISAMTKNGIEAGTAGMSLNRILLAIVREGQPLNDLTKKMTDNFHQQGFETAGAAIQALGLQKVMQNLVTTVGGNIDTFVTLYPSIRAARGALGLMVNDAEAYNSVMSILNDRNKTAEQSAQAFVQAQNSFSNQMKIVSNDVHAAAISFGEAFLPAVKAAAAVIADIAMWFSGLSPVIRNGVAVVAAITAGFLLFGGAALLLAPALAAASAGLEMVGASALVAEIGLGPLLLIALPLAVALGVLGAGFISSAQASVKAKQQIAGLADAYMQEKAGVDGAVNSKVQEIIVQKGLNEALGRYGVNILDATSALRHHKEGQDTVNQLYQQFSEKLGVTDESLKSHGADLHTINKAHQDLQGALQGSSKKYADLVAIVNNYGTASSSTGRQAVKDLKGWQGTQNEVNKAMDEAKKKSDDLAFAEQTNSNSLILFGQSAATASSDLQKLTDSQKVLQKTLEGFTGAEADYENALNRAKDAQLGFTSASNVFQTLMSENQQAMDAAASQNKKAFDMSLTDQTQAAQDQARAVQRQGQANVQDAQDQARAIKEAAQTQNDAISSVNSSVQSLGEAGHDVGRSISQAQADAQSNHKTLAQSSSDYAHQIAEDAKAQTQAAQDQARAVARANQDSAQSYVTSRQKASVSLDQFITKVVAESAVLQKWHQNLTLIGQKYGSEFEEQLRGMGEQAVPLIQSIADNIDSQGIPKLRDALAKMPDAAKVGYDDFVQAMADGNDKAQHFIDDLGVLNAEGFTALASKFEELGTKGAAALHEAVTTKSLDELDRANKIAFQSYEMTADQAIQSLDNKFSALASIGTKHGQDLVDAVGKILGTEKISPQQAEAFLDDLKKSLSSGQPLQLLLDVDPRMDASKSSAFGVITPDGKLVNFAPVLTIGGLLGGGQSSKGGAGGSTNLHQAQGGIVHFADGEENHVAQIARGGEWRVWAEDETGGEAYIPLAAMKRGRSTEILRQVAGMFGYGLQANAAGSLNIGSNISSEFASGVAGAISAGLQNIQFWWQPTSQPRILPETPTGIGPAGPMSAPPSGDLTEWINAAIQLTGAPQAWLPALYQIAMHESGGNPHSINNWDINAQRGDPSRGIFQTIGSTFKAHALPGHNDIYNPVDNAAAAIGYIIGRYGTVYNVPGIKAMAAGRPYVGYSEGGIFGDPIAMAGGGILGKEWKAWKKWSGPALGWKGAHAVSDLARQMGDRSARGFGVLKDKATGHKPYMDYGDWGARYNAENLTGDWGIAPSNKGARLNIGGDGYYPRSGRSFATGGLTGKIARSLRAMRDNVPEYPGNIDLHHRPRVRNPDGSVSTVRSITITEDGWNILIPTVSDDGRIMTNSEAIATYHQTGRELGVYRTNAAAERAAKEIHLSQEREYATESRAARGSARHMAFGGLLGSGDNATSGVVRFASYDQGGVLPPGYTVAYNGTGRNETVVNSGDNGVSAAITQAIEKTVQALRDSDRQAAPVIIDHPTPVNTQHLAREIQWSRR